MSYSKVELHTDLSWKVGTGRWEVWRVLPLNLPSNDLVYPPCSLFGDAPGEPTGMGFREPLLSYDFPDSLLFERGSRNLVALYV